MRKDWKFSQGIRLHAVYQTALSRDVKDTSFEQSQVNIYRVLRHSSQKYGYGTAKWTSVPVCDYIKKHYGVKYKNNQIYNTLHFISFSFQKWNGYYPEAEDETIKKLQMADENSATVFEDEASLPDTGKFIADVLEKGNSVTFFMFFSL